MAADDVSFDLDEHPRAGPERAHLAHVYTKEEEAAKLEGYLEVPAEDWHLVKYGTHVRYYTQKEGFRSGGFVVKNPFDIKPKGEPTEKRFVKLQNGFNDKVPGYRQWPVAYEDIAALYIKPDAAAAVVMRNLQTAVTALNSNLNKIAKAAKQLSAQLDQLEKRVGALERLAR